MNYAAHYEVGTITVERLREVLDYDPETGILRWRISTSRRVRAGMVAGSLNHGYRRIAIDRCVYLTHRIAWLYMTGAWPKDQIDHKNGVRDDNRFLNLREASNAENQHNQRHARRDNRTGLLGVSTNGGRFQAQIMVDGKQHYLGCFGTAEAAHAAYVEAKRRLHPGGML